MTKLEQKRFEELKREICEMCIRADIELEQKNKCEAERLLGKRISEEMLDLKRIYNKEHLTKFDNCLDTFKLQLTHVYVYMRESTVSSILQILLNDKSFWDDISDEAMLTINDTVYSKPVGPVSFAVDIHPKYIPANFVKILNDKKYLEFVEESPFLRVGDQTSISIKINYTSGVWNNMIDNNVHIYNRLIKQIIFSNQYIANCRKLWTIKFQEIDSITSLIEIAINDELNLEEIENLFKKYKF